MIGLVSGYCRRCIYLARINGQRSYKLCQYILMTGQRRPCPAGTGCTVRKTRPDDTDERGRVYRG